MKDLPIGVFDSGVGGLTVLRALMARLRHERFIYLGDTARLPYGTKSAETVARYARQAAAALVERGVKCIVVACNTASAVGLSGIRERVGAIPVVGVIQPSAEAACKISSSGRIAVIATEGTVRGGAYQSAVMGCRPDARITASPAQLFVALAEEGLLSGPIVEEVARYYLDPLFAQAQDALRCDTLVLGCTHFPMLMGPIRRVVGPATAIVDSAETTAIAVQRALTRAGLARSVGEGAVQFLATDGPERFARVGSRFLGRDVLENQIELVDL